MRTARNILVAVAALAACGASAAPVFRWVEYDTSVIGRAFAVAVDSGGYAYVGGTYRAGGASGNTGLFVRRYDSFGVRDWSFASAGTSTAYEDGVRAIALYPVTATCWDVIAAGVRWNGTSEDAWVSRITALGATVWQVMLDPSGASDGVNGVAVTPGGEIIVAGWIAGTALAPDIWVGRVSASGVLLDSAQVSELLGVDDALRAVAVDASGSVYVAGHQTTAGQGKNAWLAQYPASGALSTGPLWTLAVNGPDSSTDFFRGVAVDSASGAVYAVGAETGPTGWLDMLVTRATVDGAFAWTRTIDGGEQDNDEAGACVVAPGGDLLVTGAIDPPSSTFSDVWLGRFSPDGVPVSTVTRDGRDSYVDGGNGLALDASGGVRLAGVSTDRYGVAHPWFAVMMEPGPAPAVETPTGVRATPNPFRPGSGGVFDAPAVVFRGLTPGSKVRVYTLSGVLVADLEDSDRDGLISWNVKNSGGKDASSGVYLFVADSGSGSVARGKVVIIR